MKKKIIFMAFVVSMTSSALAQESVITLRGKVVDKMSKAPIEYANLRIENTSLGVISNTQGEFEFHIPEEYAKDTLNISMMGYATHKVTVQQAQPNATILLEQKSILLTEIIIQDKMLSADEIINQAVKNITINYSKQPYQMEGFFRQIQKVDNNYVSVLEAAVEVLDPGYGSKKPLGIGITEIRRSDYLKAKPYYNIADTFYTQKHNALTSTLGFNHIRELASLKVLPTTFFTERYTYKFDSIDVYDNKAVYIISAVQRNNKGYLKDPLKEERINTIIIDAETFGILQVKFEYHPKDNYTPKDFRNVTQTNDSILSIVNGHTHVYEFNSYKGLLYLKYIRWSDWVEDYNVNLKKVSHINEYRHELLINHVITDPSEFAEISKPVNPEISLYKQARDYNATFWKNYNMIYESKEERELIQNLMKQISNEKN